MRATTDARDFYDTTARWFGDPGIGERDRELARLVDDAVDGRPARVLELGAGAGGAAAATAQLGHRVVAVEASPVRAAYARRRTFGGAAGRLEVVEGDFLAVVLPGRFDAIAYWNGFGAGDDDDQRRLLGRMRAWLADAGVVLMHVYDPAWWAARAGARRPRGRHVQELGFDAATRRLEVRWWSRLRPADAVREHVRCYTEAELGALVADAGLACAAVDRREAAPWKYTVELRPA